MTLCNLSRVREDSDRTEACKAGREHVKATTVEIDAKASDGQCIQLGRAILEAEGEDDG